MNLDAKLDKVLSRHRELAELMSGEMTDPQEFTNMSREYAELTPVAEAITEYKDAKTGIADARTMLEDPEMKDLAAEELEQLEKRLPELEHQIKMSLIPKDTADEKNAILEVRAGTGGDEAALFAGDLFRMYSRYAERQGWRISVLSASEGEHGGYKEIICRGKAGV